MSDSDNLEPLSASFVQDLGSYHQQILNIHSKINSDKVIDLTTNADKYINIWDYHGGENQQWRFIYDSVERAYQIISVSTGKAMKSNADGTMDMVDPTGSFEEYDYGAYWQLLRFDNGYYLIKNMGSGLILDLDNANTANGTRIKTFTENGSDAQFWNFDDVAEPVGEFDGKILSIHSELNWKKALVLRLSDTSVDLWDYNAANYQHWRFQWNSTHRAYQIISVATGNCITANSSGDLALTSPDHQYLTSYWRTVKDEPYSCYTIENVASGMLLDVSASKTDNGTTIIAWPASGNTNQLWRLWEDETPDFDGYTVVIRILELTSQAVTLELHDDAAKMPTQQVIIYAYNGAKNQQWLVEKLSDGAFQFLSEYIFNPTGAHGAESQYWLESTGSAPRGSNVTISFLDGGESKWTPHLLPGKYDYDGRAVYSLESASQPGKYLLYDDFRNGSRLEFSNGKPVATEINKLFTVHFSDQ